MQGLACFSVLYGAALFSTLVEDSCIIVLDIGGVHGQIALEHPTQSRLEGFKGMLLFLPLYALRNKVTKGDPLDPSLLSCG